MRLETEEKTLRYKMSPRRHSAEHKHNPDAHDVVYRFTYAEIATYLFSHIHHTCKEARTFVVLTNETEYTIRGADFDARSRLRVTHARWPNICHAW